MAVRMKDIARDVGVSTITVSKVIRNHGDIGSETRERVLRRLKELNYQPNLAARALVTGRRSAVGLIVPDLIHPFFAEVAKGLSDALRDKGYSVVIASSEENPELESKGIEQMVAHGVDALIVASAQRDITTFRRIEERKIPYVLIDRRLAGLSANFVGVNDQRAGELATDHLYEAGCRRIAHIRGPKVTTAAGRAKGYRRSLLRHGLDAPADYVAIEDMCDMSGERSGYDEMTKLLKVSPRPDGVFCYNDPSAMGAMQAILDAGLRIPEDIAIIGCGNVRYAQFLRVPLSSVDQNSAGIGSRAGKLAIVLIESKSAPEATSISLEPRVIARASTARTERLRP
jgi:LacI family transcriptional regulator